jgi:hypothetical protein
MSRSSLLTLVLLTFGLTAPAQETKKPPAPKSLETFIDVKLTDGSVLRLALLDDQVEFVTPHGRLTIPVAEVKKLELGLRISDEMQKDIAAAAADLGSNDFKKREAASAILVRYREKAVPAVKAAMKSTDAEVAKRAEEVFEKLEAVVPADRMEIPDHDVLHTEKSKIAGKVVASTIKARSFAFGDVQLKLADTVAMSTTGFEKEEEKVVAQPNPGSLTSYQGPNHVGKTHVFSVTGAAQGSLWGTETYTLDSSLAAAAVHAGVLKVGQTGNVKVTILGPLNNFIGTAQNGLQSANYGAYPGAYKIHIKGK